MPRYTALEIAGCMQPWAYHAGTIRHCAVCGDETDWMDLDHDAPSCSTECSLALHDGEVAAIESILPPS